MRDLYRLVSVLAILVCSRNVDAQNAEHLEITRVAMQPALHALPARRIVVDAATFRADPAIADQFAKEIGARRGLLSEIVKSESMQFDSPCHVADDAVVVAIGSPRITGDSAEMPIAWWYQESPGVVDRRNMRVTLARTRGGPWRITQLVRGRS